MSIQPLVHTLDKKSRGAQHCNLLTGGLLTGLGVQRPPPLDVEPLRVTRRCPLSLGSLSDTAVTCRDVT